MRRLFFESKIYDYTTKKEAEKHMEKMLEKGWVIKEQGYDGVFLNGGDGFPYSVEYMKQR